VFLGPQRTGVRTHGPSRGREIVKAWRRSRPFWGGLFAFLSGLELLSISFSLNALPLIIHSAQAGLTYLISITLIIIGVLLWLQPAQRVFLGAMAIALSIASVLHANMGGFLMGMILGVTGGALATAWTPVTGPPASDDCDRRDAKRAVSGQDRAPETLSQ
jgi:hypothetical protein